MEKEFTNNEIVYTPTEIDSTIFIEIINDAGAVLLYVDDRYLESEGTVIDWYQGLNGRKVPIISTQEYYSCKAAKAILIDLGLGFIIDQMPNYFSQVS